MTQENINDKKPEEESNVIDMKPEEKTEVEEENEEEEEEGEQDHPVDFLADLIGEIEKQEKRLRAKNPHNLRQELMNNVYPIIKSAISAVIEWMIGIEDGTIGGSNEPDEEVQKIIIETAKKTVSICKKIVELDGDVVELLPDNKIWPEIASWAKDTIEKSKDALKE